MNIEPPADNSAVMPLHRNFFSRNKTFLLIGALIGLLVIAFFVNRSAVYRTEVSEFDLKATISDSAGVAPESRFILKTTAPLTPQVVEKYLKASPVIDFDVKKTDRENTFEIAPKEALASNQIYTIGIEKGPLAARDFSWAYQVKAPFDIVSSIPADTSVDAPMNTGIEIYFNRENILNPEAFIEITPKVEGSFTSEGNMVRFIPRNPLSERTIYSVKIKPGLKAKDTEDTLAIEKIIKFETSELYSENRGPSAFLSRQFSEFKPGSDVTFGVRAYNTASVNATVYRFASADEFLASVEGIQGEMPWARYFTNSANKIPEDKKIFSGTLPLERVDYSSILRMPQTFETGYYAVVISIGKTQDIAWFQINPAASFAAFASEKSLVWLKDIGTGGNMSGVPILFNGKEVGRTGRDGVALFKTPPDLIRKSDEPYHVAEKRKFFVAVLHAGALVIPMESEYGYASALEKTDAWWDYVGLNKNIYLPTDTIQFWAIQKPRNGSAVGEEIGVRLTSPYWYQMQKDVVTYGETRVRVSDHNAVTGALPFANLKPGNYTLTFSKGEEIIAQQMVTVSAYVKPAYKITVTPDKTALFAGETVTFKAKAEFFDGTPVANTSISYSAYGSNKNIEGTLTLNAQGEGVFAVTPPYVPGAYWPNHLSLSVRPTNAEEGNITANVYVLVFGPHIHNTISQKQSGGNIQFTVTTRALVLTDMQSEPYWNPEDYFGSPLPGTSTNVEVSEVIYRKEKIQTGYDAINKVSYPIYRYWTEDRPISSPVIIADQVGVAHLSFIPDSKKTYKFVFTTTDTAGRVLENTRYIYGSFDSDSYTLDSSYYLHNAENDANYTIGEEINLSLQTYDGIMAPDLPGNYIFLAVNNGDIEYTIQDTPKYIARFEAKYVPNVGIWPGWFAEGRFKNSYLHNVSFDANDRRLNIEIGTDKPTYEPGDTVNLDVRVTDKNNLPVRAEVNLSALDEAVFTLRPDERDVVNDLYRDIYSQVIIRTSNMPPYGGGGAEKGGGDGDGARSNIKEMAIFKTIVTDIGGYGHVEFKLPDNITSWRLTSQAVTKDLSAGKSVDFIPVTLPFFVDATLNKTYLAGDSLVLRLRAFGTGANLGDVNYFAESPTLDFKKLERTGGNSIEMPLGTLPVGTHELTVRASNGSYSDALIRPVSVLESYYVRKVSDFYEGIAGLKIKDGGAIGHLTLTFDSYGKGRLYNELKSLSYESGIRLDQIGSRLVASNLLNRYFGEKNEKPQFQADRYQEYSGGLRLLPYSSEELELSAIAAHLLEDSGIDRSQLRNYLLKSLGDAKSDVSRIAAALYGLTAFNEPVLTKIQALQREKQLPIESRVFIALALERLGAKEEARAYYKETIKPSVVTKSPYAYFDGLQSDKGILMTPLIATLTVRLDEPESAALALFASENVPKQTLNNFERLLYIQSALPKLDPEEVSFSYRTGSRQESKTLKNGESFSITITPEELRAFELTESRGKLSVAVSYEKRSSSETVVKDSNLSIRRQYEVNGIVKKELKEGDLVTVRLIPQFRFNALTGAYQIVDYLPSGLRVVDDEAFYQYSKYDRRVRPTEINDQQVTFMVHKDINLPIYYFARVVSKGVYKAEPALLQSLRSFESATISNEDTVTVQ